MPTGVYVRRLSTMQARLFHRVLKTDECWLWQGATGTTGHGQITNGNFKPSLDKSARLQVHRVAYELYYGKIPDGLLVCHRCDVRNCVHPKHLFLGTHADNSKDMTDKGRQKRGTQLPQSKLTEDQVRAIRASTDPYRLIGKRFGVSPAHVCHIKSGRSWAHVDSDTAPKTLEA